MKSILVPTDFSKNALNAVKYALAFAEKTKSKVILFHSYYNPSSEVYIPFTNIHYGKQDFRENAETAMKKLIASLLKFFPEANPEWIVKPGIASVNIIEIVKERTISMLIMGTTGQGAISRAIVGSTTSSVINEVPCTMIAVPPKAKFKSIAKIAVATNLEKDNLSVVKEILTFAKEFNAEISFIYVNNSEKFDIDQVLQEMVDKIKKQLKYKNVSFYVCRDSNIANGLDLFIKNNKPDILSMVTNGLNFSAPVWQTSWTNTMSNHITIPLLVLHI